jgi:hypothetical protein
MVPITANSDLIKNHLGQGGFAALPGTGDKEHLFILFQVGKNKRFEISANRNDYNFWPYSKNVNDKIRVLSENVKDSLPWSDETMYRIGTGPGQLPNLHRKARGESVRWGTGRGMM